MLKDIMKKLLLLLISLMLVPAQSYATDDTFKDVNVGIEITKPNNWYFMDISTISKNRRRVKLSDKEYEKLFQTRARLPIVSISKYEDVENRTDVSPTVNVVLTKLGRLEGTKPSLILSLSLEPLSKNTTDFKYITPPQDIELQGEKAAFSDLTYVLENQAGYIFRIRSKMWLIPKGHRALIIGMSAPAEGPDNSLDEFEAIYKTIKLN
jgi:hypothetical protein